MSKSKLGLVVGLVALAVPLIGATGAQAATMTCVFNGATGNIAPNATPLGTSPSGDIETGDPLGAPFDAGVQSVLQDNRKGPIAGDFDGGDYTFDTRNPIVPGGPRGAAVCAVDAQGTTGVFIGDIDSEGHYNNQVCGTGTAIDNSDAQLTRVVFGVFPFIDDAEYVIAFTGGQGELDITMVDDVVRPDSVEIDPPGPPDGFVNITPRDGNCVDTDVSTFLAAGAFTAVW